MAGMLETLKSPRDIASLSLERLQALSDEVRLALPAHFALRDVEARSAAGLCELTIALHKVFDFSHDRLVFDLGYQASAHHLVCGAGSEHRSKNAPHRGDVVSPYLEFLPHQPGSSISKILGMAEGGMPGKKIAVIGDGAIASGEAMEALNAGGAMNSNALIILNDNEMSISKVMGAMGEYLSRIRVGSTYNQLKKDMHRLIKAIPVVGQGLDRAAEQLKDAVASALVPGHLFETLGARYFGPVDGHHLGHIIQLLEEIKRQDGFFLLHLVTRREDTPLSISPVVEATAEEIEDPTPLLVHALEGESRFIDALATPLLDLAEADDRIVLVAVSPRELTEQNQLTFAFESKFPDRVWRADVGEMHGASFAVGLARAGRRPILMAPSAAMARAHGEILESIALDRAPVVMLATESGIVDEFSGAEHGVYDLSFIGSLPGVDIASPRDSIEAGDLLECLIALDRPAYLRLPAGFSTDPNQSLAVRNEILRGKGEVLRRGSDIAIWALGSMAYLAMEAAERLAESGLEATVVNARFMRPIDHSLLTSCLSEHTVLFTLEEHALHGGLGATVLEVAARDRLGAGNILPIALRDDPLPSGSRPGLLKAFGMDVSGLTDRMLVEYRRFVRSGPR